MLKAGTHSRLVPGAKSGLVLRLPKAGPAMLRFFCRRYDLIRSIGRLILQRWPMIALISRVEIRDGEDEPTF
ncbi:MAG: hypothetical protein DME68_09025 [Verrucomicrobia bacterium]|nr:MAG: hypothetical protein DME68_09025 [Verrucomicrobiota bacterium]